MGIKRPYIIPNSPLSNYLDTSSTNEDNILKLLERTHLLFHLDAYGLPSSRRRKAWKYYFATSSIKYSLASRIGNITRDKKNTMREYSYKTW